MRLRTPGRGQDDGAMLIFALIIITTVALVCGTLLVRGGTNFVATVSLRQVAADGYAADAAAKNAINALQLGEKAVDPGASYPANTPNGWVFDNNIDGTGCFGFNPDGSARTKVTYQNINPVAGPAPWSNTATVTCAPVPGTGIFGTAPGANDHGTGRALTILGPAGLQVNPQGNGNDALFQIHGDVASAGPITVDHGILQTTGTVSGHGCPSASSVDANGPCTDSGGSVSDPFATRTPLLTSVPANLGTWGACAGGVRTFQPGYYDDAQALTDATDGCTTSVFVPGRYYFDFHNSPTDPTYSPYAMSGGSSNVWTINKTVIGGITAGGTSQIPGRCKNPIDNANLDGVQFVFGGDSQILLGHQGNSDGRVELCASGKDGIPPIAIFALDGTTAARGKLAAGYAGTLQQTPKIAAGTVTSSGQGSNRDFVPTPSSATLAAALSDLNGATAKYSSANSNGTVSLTLNGLTPPTAIPPGSLLTGAKVEVRHQEWVTGTSGNPTIAPRVSVNVGATSGVFNPAAQGLTNTSLLAGTPMTTDTIDLAGSANLIKALGAAVHNGDLSAVSAVFAETAKGRTDAVVDSFKLLLTYTTPTLRGQTTTAIPGNCISTGSCVFIQSANAASSSKWAGSFVVQGVAYAPAGSISISLGNQTDIVAFRWGIVADHAALGSLNLFPFAYPVVSIPDAGPGFGATVTAVDLKVYLCQGNGPCSTSGPPALSSRVRMTDPVDPVTGLVDPGPETRKTEVLSWAEQR